MENEIDFNKPVGTNVPSHLYKPDNYPLDTSHSRNVHSPGINSEFGKGIQHLQGPIEPGSANTASAIDHNNKPVDVPSHYVKEPS